MAVDISDIVKIIENQNRWRGRETINLIASENAQSPAVRAMECNDFMGRYAEGHPNTSETINRYYEGTAYIDQIETMATEELKALAHCAQADVRPISGNAANTAVALSLLRGNDTVIANSIDAGGHISHNPTGVFGRRVQVRGQVLAMNRKNSISLHFWPTTEDRYHIDVAKSLDLIEQTSPNLVILGKSLFLFPEPVSSIAEICRAKNIPLLYDAAHVLGLILGGQFQNPFQEGAHLITASAHKTFPGPQRGMVLGNLKKEEELKWWTSIDRGILPGSSSSHHLHTLPGLLATIREMKQFGRAYAGQTVKNAKALGQALFDEGLAVEAPEFGFTESHQIAVNVSARGSAIELAKQLAANNIILNHNMLPGDRDVRNPSGLRIGVQEMTRFGMKETEMGEIAELIAGALQGGRVQEAVSGFRSQFTEMQYA